MIRRRCIIAVCLLLAACGKNEPPAAPSSATPANPSQTQADRVTFAVPMQPNRAPQRGKFAATMRASTPVALDDKNPAAFFSLRADYPSAIPTALPFATTRPFVRPYNYDAIFLVKFPAGTKPDGFRDIKITSVTTDTGVALSKYSLSPAGAIYMSAIPLAKSEEYTACSIRIGDEIPADTPGLWVTGVLCPVAYSGQATVSEKIPFPLEFHSQIKTGDVTLRFTGMQINPTVNTLHLDIDPTGPAEKVAKLEFFDAQDNLLAEFEPPIGVDNSRWSLSIRNWKDPMSCRVTFAQRARINVPFSLPLPSGRVLFPDQAAAPDKRPPLQIKTVTLARSQADLPAPLLESANASRIKASPDGIFLTLDLASDVMIADLANDSCKIDAWIEDDKQRQPAAGGFQSTARLSTRTLPRSDVSLEITILDRPTSGTNILTLKGTLGVMTMSSQKRTIDFGNIDFSKRGSFKVDNSTVSYTGASTSSDVSPTTTLSFLVPQSLRSMITAGEISVDGKSLPTNIYNPPGAVAGTPIQLSAPGKLTSGNVKFFAAEKFEEKRLPFHLIIGTGPRN